MTLHSILTHLQALCSFEPVKYKSKLGFLVGMAFSSHYIDLPVDEEQAVLCKATPSCSGVDGEARGQVDY